MNVSSALFSVIFFWRMAESVNNYGLYTDRDTAVFHSRSVFEKRKPDLFIYFFILKEALETYLSVL